MFNLFASINSECINLINIWILNLVILRSDVSSSVFEFLKNWILLQWFFFIQILDSFWFRGKGVKVAKCKIESFKSLFYIVQVIYDFVLTGNYIKTSHSLLQSTCITRWWHSHTRHNPLLALSYLSLLFLWGISASLSVLYTTPGNFGFTVGLFVIFFFPGRECIFSVAV